MIGYCATKILDHYTVTRLDTPGRDVSIVEKAPVATTPLSVLAAAMLLDAGLPSRTAEANRVAALLAERFERAPAVTLRLDTVRDLIRQRAVA